MLNQVVVVTGANRGIGLEFARQFKALGATVIATCRSSAPALEALGVQVVTGVDVSRPDSLAPLVAAARSAGHIDILVNNAGILMEDSLDNLNPTQLMEQFVVNSIGPLQTTATLRPFLRAGSKVAIVTSLMGSIDDNGSGGMYGYRMSKAAVNIAGKSLSVDLKPQGVAVALLHPGFVATDMTARWGHDECISTETSVTGQIQRIRELTVDNSGRFLNYDGTVLPW
eukprot:gnl/Spiro4/21150_TR10323_c0_g1_i1.p2 gnl/Spiro4/21150_TR10323_c0_g1~~gnl/Spiro4/21150_TR10323_c0_g1_i1.p2  ORF type:complete len:240 (+),score=75.55 gnl/Spiro4/21150_TR10323_c0_g1_i1:40-720(+)